MTQRRLPSTAAAAREVKTGSATVADKQLMGEEQCSLQVAFEELQCHLRQSRDEIARLERVKAKLRAEVEAKNISLGYLQQQLDKRDQEAEDLRSKLEQESQRNAELTQQLADVQKANAGGFGPCALPQSTKKQPFRYPVEVGLRDSDQEDPAVWTLDGMSQLLMARMQQEMKSLEESGGEVVEDFPSGDGSRTPLSHDQPRKGVAAKGAPEEETIQHDSSLQAAMRLIATLTAQLNTARERVLGQRAALLSTLARLRDSQPKRPGERPTRPALTGTRPSDESFRVYFTQQLSASGLNTELSQGTLPEEELERVCPICEVLFPRRFSQDDFESHVLEHLSGHPLVLDPAQ
uniref:UBZ1-type domain-containing protein n=1 Tax=Rhipicephalus pulchellus TaxID=72859 RepID=L7LZJ4_RHIPC